MSAEAGLNSQPSSRVARSDAVIFTEFDDATVMMDAEVGSYYELNRVGAKIWALAESRPRVAEVCEALVAEHDVLLDTCGDEVRAFLDELLRLEVIRILPPNGANETGNDDRREPAATRRGEAVAKLGWITPTIRVIEIERTRSGTDDSTYENPHIMGSPYAPDS
ncbi:MAG: PqqD family protein [Acidobacteria bacterium]|nr:PqqD family protein [Acidobacteriota bacterium]